MSHKKTTFLLMVLAASIALFAVAISATAQSEATPTATATIMPISLFPDDPCVPPCFFGLVPGVSTVAEVIEFLNTAENIEVREPFAFGDERDPITGYIINGHYEFYLGPWEHLRDSSSVSIYEGIVDMISLHVNVIISPEQIVAAFGQPSQIRLLDNYGNFELKFIYLSLNTEVIMYALRQDCELLTLNDDFMARFVTFFSPRAALEPDRMSADPSIPRILQWLGGEERHVPLEIWDQWTSGEVIEDCNAAWEDLPVGIILPTVMPTLLGTVSPSRTPVMTPMPSATP